jgi:small subunit ribosomal protein S6
MPEASVAVGTDREYETIYVLRPDVEKTKAQDVATRMTDVIAKKGGKLTRVESWGRRVLAYPVERHTRGVYIYLKYLGAGDIVSELERNLRMLDAVIKFQTVKTAEGLAKEAVAVDEGEVKFEEVEPPAEDEEEFSLARSLGLEGNDDRAGSGRDGGEEQLEDDASGDGESGDQDAGPVESEEEE